MKKPKNLGFEPVHPKNVLLASVVHGISCLFWNFCWFFQENFVLVLWIETFHCCVEHFSNSYLSSYLSKSRHSKSQRLSHIQTELGSFEYNFFQNSCDFFRKILFEFWKLGRFFTHFSTKTDYCFGKNQFRGFWGFEKVQIFLSRNQCLRVSRNHGFGVSSCQGFEVKVLTLKEFRFQGFEVSDIISKPFTLES
jgi:hypothetical protein